MQGDEHDPVARFRTMTDTERGLLNAVIESPDDDNVRIVCAGWLEDHGQEERAKFICAQIELAKIDAQRPRAVPMTADNEAFWQRRQHLKAEQKRLWGLLDLGIGHGVQCVLNRTYRETSLSPNQVYAVYERGFVSELRCTLAEFMGGDCERCRVRRGREGYLVHKRAYDDCPQCNGTGRVPGLAETIFRDHPVMTVMLTDVEPQESGFGWWFGFENGVRNELRHCLPNEIMEYNLQERGGSKYFPTREAAIAAKSRACVDFARGRCGFEPLQKS
jgi:uncharacterized protein (TIGR02996 family)